MITIERALIEDQNNFHQLKCYNPRLNCLTPVLPYIP